MTKRRIYWPYGNPESDAWQVETSAGVLVVRRNHPLVSSGGRPCQGWDVWLDSRHLGAVGTCSLAELVGLSRRRLVSAAFPACCARHRDFSAGRPHSRPNWGGKRPNAGRKPRGAAKRVDLATTVDPSTLRRIDELRGETSRGEFIDTLIRAHTGR